jgi:hypothetical protein
MNGDGDGMKGIVLPRSGDVPADARRLGLVASNLEPEPL